MLQHGGFFYVLYVKDGLKGHGTQVTETYESSDKY